MTSTPIITLDILEQEVKNGSFLNVQINKTKFNYPDGSEAQMTLDIIERKLNDAIVIVAYYIENNEPYVYLRSCIRPAVILNDFSKTMRLESFNVGNLWELPAGLIERHETGYSGLLEAAKRETREEIGFDLEIKDFKPLGTRIFSLPGSIAERLFFVVVEVNPKARKEPTEDGSPLEKGGIVQSVSLKEAIANIENGIFSDAKTEIGLSRFEKFLPKIIDRR